MKKALFMDFDGTMFSHKTHDFPASTLQAIKTLREKGHLIFICSGRSLSELDFFDMSKITVDGLILSNGLAVYDKDGRIIHETLIDGLLKEKIVNIFNNKTTPISLSNSERMFINFVDDRVRQIHQSVSSPVPVIDEYRDDKIYMASAYFDIGNIPPEIEELWDIGELTFWHEGAIDVVPKGMSKVSGIKTAMDHYRIDKENTIGFGDGDNDIDMLRYCQIGIAMGNASSEVKAVSDYVTDDIDNDGLYKALVHYGLL